MASNITLSWFYKNSSASLSVGSIDDSTRIFWELYWSLFCCEWDTRRIENFLSFLSIEGCWYFNFILGTAFSSSSSFSTFYIRGLRKVDNITLMDGIIWKTINWFWLFAFVLTFLLLHYSIHLSYKSMDWS